MNGKPTLTPSLRPLTGASTLRHLLSTSSSPLLCPGVFDGLTTRLALSTGHTTLYMTGAGTSISRLGWADLGLATQSDMADTAAMVCSLSPSTPVITDADTGYGGPLMVSRTVARYARAGVAALHLEDQDVSEKRCGHLGGKKVVSREAFAARLRAAVQTRDELGSEMMIFARTDARATHGFAEALERLRIAVEECGVDGVFCEAVRTKEEARRVCEIFAGRVPCLLNMVPGGATPEISLQEAGDMGYRIVIHPGACLEGIVAALRPELKRLRVEGTMPKGEGYGNGVKEAFNLAGLQECVEIDRKAGGVAYENVTKE